MTTPHWEWTQYPNTQPRVGETMTLTLSVFDSPLGTILPGLPGYVRISASPQGSYAGSMSVVANDLTISLGYTTFECSIDAYGVYQIGAYYIDSPSPGWSPSPYSPSPGYSPSPDFAIDIDNPDIYVLNNLPSLEDITPVHVIEGTTGQTLTLTGADFYSDSIAVLSDPLVGSSWQARTTGYNSSTELTMDLLDADMLLPGVRAIRVKNVFAGPYGTDGYSNTLNFTVDDTDPVVNDFEKLPSTIEVWKAYDTPPSPFTADASNEAFQRVYPADRADLAPVTLAQVTADRVVSATASGIPNIYPKNANPGNVDILTYVLSQVVKTTTPCIAPGTYPAAGSAFGAWEVINIHKGAYNPISFNQVSGLGSSWAPKLPVITSARTPLILRANKDEDGVPDSVVLMRKQTSVPLSGNTLTLTSTDAYRSWNYHFYDLKIEHSGQAGFFSLNSEMPHRNIRILRCDAMGTWDARGIPLTPDRFIISVEQDQEHYNMDGDVIEHISGNPAQDRDIAQWEIMMLQEGAPRTCSSYWTHQPDESGWSALHIPLRSDTPGVLPAGYTSTVDDPKYFVRLTWVSTTGITTNYYGNGPGVDGPLGVGVQNLLVGHLDDIGTPVFTEVPFNGTFPLFEFVGEEWPMSGQVVGGIAHYPMVKFKYPGAYSFRAQLVDRSTGSDVFVGDPSTVTVLVTSTGVSQNKCYASKVANVPQVNLSETSADGYPATEVFTMPVALKQTHILHAAGVNTTGGAGGTNFNVWGYFKYVIDPTSFAAGWRWLLVDGTYLTSNWALGRMSDGVLTHPTLVPSWEPDQDQTPGGGARLVYTGTTLRRGVVSNITISVLLVNTFFGNGTPVSSTLDVSGIQRDGVAGGTPLNFIVSVKNIDTPSAEGDLFDTDTNLDTSLIQGGKGTGRVRGTPFAAGWPGDPDHPNYEAGHELLYPNNTVDVCPGLLYDGGIASKWGAYAASIEGLAWIGGSIHHSAYEHGMLADRVGNMAVTNIAFFRTGTAGFQWTNHRQANWNRGPVWDTVHVIGCSFRDIGNQGTGSDCVIISEHAGPVIISGSTFDCCLNESLRHLPSSGGTGAILISGGDQLKQDVLSANPVNGRMTNNLSYPFLVDVNGVPLITTKELNTLVDLNDGLLQGQDILSHVQTLIGGYPLLKEWKADGVWRNVQAEYTHNSDWASVLGSAMGVNLTNPDHPANNRFFGDPGNPLGGAAGYWDPATAPESGIDDTPVWPVVDGTGATRYVGGPTFGSLHQTGSVLLIDNTCLAQDSATWSDTPPSWPSSNAHPIVRLSGMRELSLVNNTIQAGLTYALSLGSRSDVSGDSGPTDVPIGIWDVSFGNVLVPSGSLLYYAVDDATGHAPILDYLTKPSPNG